MKSPNQIRKEHPTGLAVVITNTVVFVLSLFDIEMAMETLAALNIVVGGWVSILSPRNV